MTRNHRTRRSGGFYSLLISIQGWAEHAPFDAITKTCG